MNTKAIDEVKRSDQVRIAQAIEILCDVYGDWPVYFIGIRLIEGRYRSGISDRYGQHYHDDLAERIEQVLRRRGILKIRGRRKRSTKPAQPTEANQEKTVTEGDR